MFEYPEYEWNVWRKLWHTIGCLLMLTIFYLWQSGPNPSQGLVFLVSFAWAETGIAFAIDLIRFHSPRQNQAVRNLPLFGKAMRQHEENCFNATTYYLLASAILITAYRLNWCQGTTLVMAIAVLGIADPTAAWVRYQLHKHRLGYERPWGLIAFAIASFVVMWLVSWWHDHALDYQGLLAIGLIVALIESYTKDYVSLVRPLTRRLQHRLTHSATVWLFRLYPDDNLVVPLAVAVLAGLIL